MRVSCALLCDAVTTREGLLHILGGGVARASRPTFPSPLGVAVALAISTTGKELGEKTHNFSIQLEGPDGLEIVEISGELSEVANLEDSIAPDEELVVPIPVSLPVQATVPGQYLVRISLDKREVARLPLSLVQDPSADQAPTDAPESP